MRAKDFRKEAREALNGKWQTALLISLICSAIIFGITLIVNFVSEIFSIITIVIAPPLTYGTAYAYYHLKNGENIGCGDFLKVGFSNFGRSWKIVWEIAKRTWWCYLIMILLIIVPIVFGILIYNTANSVVKPSYSSSYSYDYYDDAYSSYLDDYKYDYNYNYNYNYNHNYDNDDYLDNYDYSTKYNNSNKDISTLFEDTSSIKDLGIVLAIWIAIIVVFVIIGIKFLLYVYAYYSAVANENITPKDAVLESERLMKGNRGRYFSLMLSFFGWYLLVGLVSSLVAFTGIGIVSSLATQIGTIILTPYVTFATIAFYQDLKRKEDPSFNNTANYNSVGNNNINNYQNYIQTNSNSNMSYNNVQNNDIINNNQNTGYVVNRGISNDINSINNQNINFNNEMNNGNKNENQGDEQKTEENKQFEQVVKEQDAQKMCMKCGFMNSKDSEFCTNCGNKL